jgi:hypothetical protein
VAEPDIEEAIPRSGQIKHALRVQFPVTVREYYGKYLLFGFGGEGVSGHFETPVRVS